jgi:hypothetical protein
VVRVEIHMLVYHYALVGIVRVGGSFPNSSAPAINSSLKVLVSAGWSATMLNNLADVC